MVNIHPFKAWHPSPEQAEQISCPPYDVIGTEEARTLAKSHAESFLHVIRPEIDLPKGIAFNDSAVYQKGAKNFQYFINNGIIKQDETEALYIYQLVWKDNTQTGIFGCVSVQDYDDEVILKHELTRPDKEDDRTRHIIAQQAHAEPVMLTFKDQAGIGQFSKEFSKKHEPLFDFTTSDDITHRLWKVMNTEKLKRAFANLDHLYIADGHHRCKSAARAAREQRKKNDSISGNEEFNYFPAVIFPMSEMNILAYNRIIFQVPDNFKSILEKRFQIQDNAKPIPDKKGDTCFYLDGNWFSIHLPEEENATAAEELDVYRLQHFILNPMLGIDDPRRNDNISFVGGIRGSKELEKRVDSGEADLAISMYPTAIEELVDVSDQHLLMPPKSTWFEPKLRSGLLIHTF